MTPAQRLAMAAAMSDEVRALAEAGIRHRHPDFSDREIRAALVELLLGRATFVRARTQRLPAAR